MGQGTARGGPQFRRLLVQLVRDVQTGVLPEFFEACRTHERKIGAKILPHWNLRSGRLAACIQPRKKR